MGQAPQGETYNLEGCGLALIAGAADLGNLTPSPKKWTTAPTKVGKAGDIIVCVRATIGDLNWADRSYCYGRGVAALRVSQEHDPAFIWYWLEACRSHLLSLGRGATFKQISKEDLSNLQTPVLSLNQQRNLVARIQECMQRVDEIEKLKTASRIQQRYLSASLIESELHLDLTDIEGWTNRTVGELVTTVRNGRSIAQDTEGLADGAVLTLTAVRSIDLGIVYKKPIALPKLVAMQFGIDAGDVFVSRANTIELVGLSAVAMEEPADRLIYPDLLIKLKVNPALIVPRYLAYALRSASSRKQIKARALGSSQTMVKISGERLREVSIPVPSLVVQAKIVSRLDAAHSLMRQLATESLPGEIEVLRGAVLRKAFAGVL
jgi:type I restriction enzyme S subunit